MKKYIFISILFNTQIIYELKNLLPYKKNSSNFDIDLANQIFEFSRFFQSKISTKINFTSVIRYSFLYDNFFIF